MADNKSTITNIDYKASMEYLVNLGRERTDIRTVEINGETYTPDNLTRVKPVYPERPQHFRTSTLSGLVDFLRYDVDGLSDLHKKYIVSVDSPCLVSVHSPIYGPDCRRDCVAMCDIVTSNLSTDCFMDAEDFNIMLQAKVIQSPNRDLVLKFVGSMRDEQSNQTADDGFSQRVTIKTGVAQVGDVTVVNPVYLAPRRTFPEIEQPESPYVLRLKEGPQAALFRTDDLQWKVEAITRIGQYLRDALKEFPQYVVIA